MRCSPRQKPTDKQILLDTEEQVLRESECTRAKLNQAGQTLRMTRSYSKWTLLWFMWTVLILMVGILPLSNFVGHSHWQYIKWVPTQEQLQSPLIVLDLFTDVLANILLFVPFGFLYIIRLQGRKGSYATAFILALILSGGIELYQVYCHNRSTSLLDLIDNVVGALLGMHLALKWSQKERQGELAVS